MDKLKEFWAGLGKTQKVLVAFVALILLALFFSLFTSKADASPNVIYDDSAYCDGGKYTTCVPARRPEPKPCLYHPDENGYTNIRRECQNTRWSEGREPVGREPEPEQCGGYKK